MAEYIDREEAKAKIREKFKYVPARIEINEVLNSIPAADVRPVVLCRDCVNYVESEEVNGEEMCVRDAEWSVEDGCYYGFTEYPSPDWFCADGERREES